MLALDTNILIALQKLEVTAVSHYQLALKSDLVVIPAVVHYESRRGLLAPNHSSRLTRLDTLLNGHQIIPFDQQTADIAAQLHHKLRIGGSLIEDADILIAATAIRHRATLVTRNIAHFQRIPGLLLADWRQETP